MLGLELPQTNKIESYKLSVGFYPQIAEDVEYTDHSYRGWLTKNGCGNITPARDFLFAGRGSIRSEPISF